MTYSDNTIDSCTIAIRQIGAGDPAGLAQLREVLTPGLRLLVDKVEHEPLLSGVLKRILAGEITDAQRLTAAVVDEARRRRAGRSRPSFREAGSDRTESIRQALQGCSKAELEALRILYLDGGTVQNASRMTGLSVDELKSCKRRCSIVYRDAMRAKVAN